MFAEESVGEPSLLVEQSGHTAILTLNRPKSLNALSRELRARLIGELARLDKDASVSVAILTGRGRAFCAGLDLREIAASGQDVNTNVDSENVVAAIVGFSKPLIGAINGLAVTGGLEISLACDILIASERAQFADTHVRVGIYPGWGLSQRLSRAIGLHRAKELSLSGRFFSAHEAYDWGLVNRVVADEQLLALAREVADEIAANDPEHVVRMKALMDVGFSIGLSEALEMETTWAKTLNARVTADDVERGHRAARARAPRAR